jgi:hypothetical protein
VFKSRESKYIYSGDFTTGKPNRKDADIQSIPMSLDASSAPTPRVAKKQ